MNYKLYILSIITMLSISCSKEITKQNDGVPVNFSTAIDQTTKADDYFFAAGEKLGVFGYNIDQGENWGDGNQYTPDYMYNIPLKYTGEKWTTDKFYYWSPNPLNRKRFYAYYPYAENGNHPNITLFQNNDAGSPYLLFDLTDGKTDFITCSAQEGNVEEPTINFTAKHALAKLSIGFATDIYNGYAYAKAIKVNGIIPRGVFNFDKEGGDGFTYESDQRVDLDLTQFKNEDIFVDSVNPIYIDEYTLYLLPSDSQDGKGGVQGIETVINGVTKTINLSSVPLTAGKNTMIKIIINQKEVTIKATIGNWEEGGSINDTID